MSAHTFDTTGMDACPFMPVFGAPALSIERGRGTEVWDTDGKRYLDFLSGIAVTSLGHANPVIADAISRQASTLLHVSNFFTNPQATAAAVKVNELLEDATGPRRSDVLHQLRGRVQRVRAQAGSQVGRARPAHRGECVRELPRTHARDAGCHRPAGQARAVRADARRVQARRVGRPRRDAGVGRRVGRGGDHRTDPGRGRRQPGARRATSRASATSATTSVP